MTHPDMNFEADGYLLADGIPPPPPITSDVPPEVATWIEQVLAVLHLAANLGDPTDNAEGQQGYAERQALTKDALSKFPATEAESQAKLNSVGDQATQLAQQIPQMASGVAGAVAGAIGGAFQPLTQMPQQLAQAAQGFMQQGMGALQHVAPEELSPEDLAAPALDDEFSGGASELGEGGGGAGGGIGGTAPMSMLGPPATPSAPTVPTSARATPPVQTPATPPSATPAGGMGGYPMMPPGGMHGAGGDGKDDKPATKRVSVPSVKNGAPVQGRISVPPPAGPTISKQVEGKTVSTRRIVVPTDKSDDERSR